jgi:predicted cation transporter
MHKTDVNTEVFNTQADNIVNTTVAADIHQLSFDIGSSVIDSVILVDALFDALDGVDDVPCHLKKMIAAVNCFATCAKRHLTLIGEASDKITELTQPGAPA